MAEPTPLVLSVTYFGILLGIGIIVANHLKKHRIPDTFFLLLIGLILGPTFYMNEFVTQFISITLVDVSVYGIEQTSVPTIPDFLRILALIMVVYTSMFNLGIRAFRSVGHMALNLAIAGIVINTVVLGFVGMILFGFDPIISFLLAAVVSGTGTGVIFAFQDSLKGAKRALNVVKVESILNSPLSVLIPVLLLTFLQMQEGPVIEPMIYLNQFWIMIIAGIGAGAIFGLAAGKLLKGMTKQYSALMLFALALIAYSLAEVVGGSGMIAVAVAGLLCGNSVRNMHRDEVQNFDDHLSEMLRISVFTLLGAQITIVFGITELLLILVFFLFMFFLRPLYLFPILGKKRKTFDKTDLILMSFVSPRGLSAAAIAPLAATILITIGVPTIANLFMNIVFVVILLSVLFSTIFGIIAERQLVSEYKERMRNRKQKESIANENNYLEMKLSPSQVKEKEKII